MHAQKGGSIEAPEVLKEVGRKDLFGCKKEIARVLKE